MIISEQNEQILLKSWLDDPTNFPKIPKNLKGEITPKDINWYLANQYGGFVFQQGSCDNFFANIKSRYEQLEEKNQKQKEQTCWFIFKKTGKERFANVIIDIFLILIGFFLSRAWN